MPDADWSGWLVADLRAELKRRGLSQAGKKAELVNRLCQVDQDDQAAVNGSQARDESPLPPDGAIGSNAATNPQAHDVNEPQFTAADELAMSNDALLTADPSSIGAISKPEDPDPTNSSHDAISKLEAPEPTNTSHNTESEVVESISVGDGNDIDHETNTTDFPPRKRWRHSSPIEEEPATKRLRSEVAERDTNHTAMAIDESHDAADSFNEPTGISEPYHPDPLVEPNNSRGTEDQEAEEGRSLAPKAVSTAKEAAIDEDSARQKLHGQEQSHYPPADETLHDTEPALHPLTTAIYIKNLKRPLRLPTLKARLLELASPAGSGSDTDVIVDLYLDPIRTHAFVLFDNVTVAARVRIGLHQQIWPDERNREPLWVDYFPAENFREWVDRETRASRNRAGTMSRWEIVYSQDVDGQVRAVLEKADARGGGSQRRTPPPPSIPTGPSQQYPGVKAAPVGPRGERGSARSGRRRRRPSPKGEIWQATRALPSLLYKTVPRDLAEARLSKMRSFVSANPDRDLGREDEINRYTFEMGDSFVDRGKEIFIGIRPPHREQERQRQQRRLGGGGGGDGAPPPPSNPRFRPGYDSYQGGSTRDFSRRSETTPRNRFDGGPLPSYQGSGADRRGRGSKFHRRY